MAINFGGITLQQWLEQEGHATREQAQAGLPDLIEHLADQWGEHPDVLMSQAMEALDGHHFETDEMDRHDRILVECLRDRLELLEGDSALYGDPIDPRAALAALEGEVLEINRRLGDEGPNSWTRLSLEVRSRHIAAALAEQE